MADYIVKDTELTGVANSIRTAGSTSSLLTFPNGFISAINNISGGGGSSDLTTAEVTIINNSGTLPEFQMPVAIPEATVPFPKPATARNLGIFLGAEDTVTAILYKGSAEFRLPDGTQFTVSGNIERDETLPFGTITGNGTITITG